MIGKNPKSGNSPLLPSAEIGKKKISFEDEVVVRGCESHAKTQGKESGKNLGQAEEEAIPSS